ncbi:hypothetical protein UCRPA7_1808 [Phaeoacremonium minimum UCRPA7]|uniref:Uncharacterized protein n=1 Tax=Phaeoacremonium minimum (strain UCR-PA7) TaxID=1286976 RepID=R8BTG8_PHAM7|nr:hypothetical protein UCRPA7_1808 [Phaeoacremonium minimum UCRPA7]EOO02688.1 hypothetical protein UCRPA7_1808 [Phaeoacremonium minimum UCRPA7]
MALFAADIRRGNTTDDRINHLRELTDILGIDLKAICSLRAGDKPIEIKNLTKSIKPLPDYPKSSPSSVGSVHSSVRCVMKSAERKEARKEAKVDAQKKKVYDNFHINPVKVARPNVTCRTGETNERAWEDVYLKSQSETVNIVNVREFKLPETPKARTKRAKNFAIDVTIAEKAYIAGHENHAFAELRLIYDRDDTAMFNKTTDNIDDEPRQDRDLHVAKKKAVRHLRSASISPELLRKKAASRLVECRDLNETTNLLTRDPAIESINHVFESPYRKRPTTPKEANRFNDLLSRLAAQRTEMADPAIVAIKAAVRDKPSDPHEATDKIVATQEQLAEKARFKRSDSGYLSPPTGIDDDHASDSTNAPAITTPEHSNLAAKHVKKTSPDSGINSPTESSTLNPKAMEFVSSCVTAAPTKLKVHQSFAAVTRPPQEPKWEDNYNHPISAIPEFEPVAPPAPIIVNQVFPPASGFGFPAQLPHDRHINIAPYQEMPPYVVPSMLPPPPPACPPCPPFPMMHGSAPTFYPAPATAFMPVSRPAPHPKPRGHNAMEQQQYEAWLEYKRSTDPTFHQKGRERQQRRFAGRQNQ